MYALMQTDFGTNYKLHADRLIYGLTHGGFTRSKLICDFIARMDAVCTTPTEDDVRNDFWCYISVHSFVNFVINPFCRFASMTAKKLCVDFCLVGARSDCKAAYPGIERYCTQFASKTSMVRTKTEAFHIGWFWLICRAHVKILHPLEVRSVPVFKIFKARRCAAAQATEVVSKYMAIANKEKIAL